MRQSLSGRNRARRFGVAAVSLTTLTVGCGSGNIDNTGGAGGGSGGDEQVMVYEAPIQAADRFFAISPNDTTLAGDPFYQDFENGSQANTLRALGAGMVRINFCNWPNARDALEKKVNAARNAGLAVLAELDYCTVPGDSQAGDPDARQRYWHKDSSRIDSGNDFVAAFAQAAKEIATEFAGRVAYYGIWNEPDAVAHISNGAWDWDGACRPEEGGYYYGKDENGKPYGHQEDWALCPRQLGTLTTNAYLAIHEVDAGAQIAAANIILQGPNPGDLSDAYYDAFRASPAVKWHLDTKGRLPWDVIGIHPYYYTPVAGSKDSLAVEVQHWKDRVDSTVAITEYGWTGTECDHAPYVSPGDEAKYVTSTFQIGREKQLPFVLWFNYLSVPTGTDCGLDMGVRGGDAKHAWKPSAQGFCDAAKASACPVSAGSQPRFCPTASVPRSKMAVYLEKWSHVKEPGWTPPPAQHLFVDVAADDPDAAWMEQLLHDGVSKGQGGDPTTFGPTDPVPREQMAAFLMRMKYMGPDLPAPASDPFKDVPASNQFAGDIQKLHELQITVGCDDQGNFCPSELVPRQQMAAFLMRAIHGYDNPPPKGSGSGRFIDVGEDNEFRDYIAQAVDSGIMEACE